jgi:Fic family protein
MPRFETRRWAPDPTAMGGRRSRQAFSYKAFVPDEIAALDPQLSSKVAGLLSDAERAVQTLNLDPPNLASLEVLARRLLRAESVASSWLEGLRISQRRLARAEALEADQSDVTARSVLGNVAAMEQAVKLGELRRNLRLSDLLRVHKTLMRATEQPEGAGALRLEQNWLGGTPFNPLNAEFIPPPPELVAPLMEDLLRFVARTDLQASVQAAIAHAQFETIHPFGDGNGRVGRALIHIVLSRRGLAPRFVPPVSLVLAANSARYIGGLIAFREGRLADWLGVFARSLDAAARKSVVLAAELAELQRRWRERCGQPRRDSSAEALIQLLPAHPVLTVDAAATLLNRSKQAANEALSVLERASVLKQTSIGRRNRAFEAVELVRLVDAFERELAIPEDGESPRRPAPTARGRERHDPS